MWDVVQSFAINNITQYGSKLVAVLFALLVAWGVITPDQAHAVVAPFTAVVLAAGAWGIGEVISWAKSKTQTKAILKWGKTISAGAAGLSLWVQGFI